MPRLDEKEVWNALTAGRAYVAFDWLADAAGFVFTATSGTVATRWAAAWRSQTV